MVKFRTKFDQTVLQKINKQGLKSIWKIYPFLIILFAGIGILTLRTATTEGDVFFGFFIIGFGILFLPLVQLIAKAILKKQQFSMPILGPETIEEYCFDTDRLTIIQTRGDDYNASTNARYNYLYLVVETKTDYFFYINKAQSHVVPKDSLVEGSLEQLNSILRENLGPKFKELKK